MSIPARTQQIADAVYRTVIEHARIRDQTHFALDYVSRDSIHKGVAFLIYFPARSIYDLFDIYKLVDTINISDIERLTVIPLVRSRLHAEGLQEFSPSCHVNATMVINIESLEPVPISETDNASFDTETTTIDDHASFFRAVCLTPDQVHLIQAELPDGAPTNELFILSGFSTKVLAECGLKRVQIQAWVSLISSLLAAKAKRIA